MDDVSNEACLHPGVIAYLATQAQANKTVDATGKYVIPGGIDPHAHLDFPFGGTVSSDDFRTGTIAVAVGGTTSVVDFAVQQRGHALSQALEE